MLPSMPTALLLVFLIFFVLGFLLYSAAYAAIGSMCSTVQETQQAQMPVMLFIVMGLMSMFALLNEPNGSLARVLSLIPPLAPFVVPVRYSIAPIPLPDWLPLPSKIRQRRAVAEVNKLIWREIRARRASATVGDTGPRSR